MALQDGVVAKIGSAIQPSDGSCDTRYVQEDATVTTRPVQLTSLPAFTESNDNVQ